MKENSSYTWKQIIGFNVAVVLAVLGLFYLLYPQGVREVIFITCMRNGWYVLPWVALIVIIGRYVAKGNSDILDHPARHRRQIIVAVTLSLAAGLWCLLIHSTTDYMTYKLYAEGPKKLARLIPAAPESVRFTPFANACTDLGNSISATGEHVEALHVQPIVTPHGFGYVAPITPSGVLNVFMSKNPGYLYLDDSFAADADSSKRISRIDEPQEVGLGMEWMDNLNLVLAHSDLFATFDTPHYLALDPKQPNKLTMVVSKIKYSMLWRLPYWAGINVVHPNGDIEVLSADEAKKDKRFKGQWIYPMVLARKYIELQNYGCGWTVLTPYVRVAGKLEVENLDGYNQFPFLTRGVDGKTYLVTATKGEGSAKGLFRMYYTDATTGEMSYHEFGSHEVVYGAGATLERMANIPGYQWYHKGKGEHSSGSGMMERIEPVYIVRPNDPRLYWKATITNISHSGISATAVCDASRPDDILIFNKRYEFESWVHQREVTAVKPVTSTPVVGTDLSGKLRKELLSEIDLLTEQMARLRKRVESLPVNH